MLLPLLSVQRKGQNILSCLCNSAPTHNGHVPLAARLDHGGNKITITTRNTPCEGVPCLTSGKMRRAVFKLSILRPQQAAATRVRRDWLDRCSRSIKAWELQLPNREPHSCSGRVRWCLFLQPCCPRNRVPCVIQHNHAAACGR